MASSAVNSSQRLGVLELVQSNDGVSMQFKSFATSMGINRKKKLLRFVIFFL